MGKMTSTISSNKLLRKKKKMNQSKERFKTTVCGSTLQKIGMNGLDLKKNTQ